MNKNYEHPIHILYYYRYKMTVTFKYLASKQALIAKQFNLPLQLTALKGRKVILRNSKNSKINDFRYF